LSSFTHSVLHQKWLLCYSIDNNKKNSTSMNGRFYTETEAKETLIMQKTFHIFKRE